MCPDLRDMWGIRALKRAMCPVLRDMWGVRVRMSRMYNRERVYMKSMNALSDGRNYVYLYK